RGRPAPRQPVIDLGDERSGAELGEALTSGGEAKGGEIHPAQSHEGRPLAERGEGGLEHVPVRTPPGSGGAGGAAGMPEVASGEREHGPPGEDGGALSGDEIPGRLDERRR